MQDNLKQQVAIVTGAGGRMGSALAHALAVAGASVAVNDINPDRAERVAESIRRDGHTALAVAADVANRFHCVNLIESTRAAWGRLDILVNHAVVRPNAPLLKMDEWAWQRCFDVNLKSAFFMTQLVGRVMVEENVGRGGRIINCIAIDEATTLPGGFAAFQASQAGLHAFSAASAQELGPQGIQVHAIEITEAAEPGQTAAQVVGLCLGH